MMLRRTTKGDKLPSDWGFKLMAFGFKVRDFFRPRLNTLKEVGIKPGHQALDYGCGPGSYIVPLVELVGDTGKVYALDAHPLAIKMVRNMISRKRLKNVRTIFPECSTGLLENSLDVVLLYDTLHDLGDSNCVLNEIHRILKPDGILSLSDHHLQGTEIVAEVTGKGLFKLKSKRQRNYSFRKQ